MELNEEQKQVLSQAQSRYGLDAVHVVETSGETFIVRNITRAEYKRFRSYAMDKLKQVDAFDVLVSDVVLYPTPNAAQAIYDRKPATVEAIGGFVLEQAGLGQEVQKKAL